MVSLTAARDRQMPAFVVQLFLRKFIGLAAGRSPPAIIARVIGVSAWNRSFHLVVAERVDADRETASVFDSMRILNSRGNGPATRRHSSNPRFGQPCSWYRHAALVVIGGCGPMYSRGPAGRRVVTRWIPAPETPSVGRCRPVRVAALLAPTTPPHATVRPRVLSGHGSARFAENSVSVKRRLARRRSRYPLRYRHVRLHRAVGASAATAESWRARNRRFGPAIYHAAGKALAIRSGAKL